MQSGKTIVAKLERPESDSERERVRKTIRRRKIFTVGMVILFVGILGFLAVRAFQGWYEWISRKDEVIKIEVEPTVEVIDERTGGVIKNLATSLSARMRELIFNLEEEFALQGYKVIRARIPADKLREIDLEIEGVSGVVKVSTDRSAAVSAEDGARMIKYLEKEGITEVQYIDVRIERKGYWK